MPCHTFSCRVIFLCFLSALFIVQSCIAQDTVTRRVMEEVIIKAFDQNRKLMEVPASVNVLNRQVMERFNPQSLVQAVNATPGVRMEERSPGSYRFSIRGSTLRSPFGVRNLKVYFNDLPITDPGGQTYLNQLGYYNFTSLEIIKGPGSSLYGAGTGGVLLIESLNGKELPGVQLGYSGGSYGLQNMYASITTGSGTLLSRASFQHQVSNGYRDHSSLNRDVHSWSGNFHWKGNKILKASFLYGDLFYETPGALTATEMKKDPKSARPASGSVPGAAESRASVHQRSFLSGCSYEQQFTQHWQNKSTLYGMFTELKNPTLRNYGRNSEPHVGGRTVFRFSNLPAPYVLNIDLGAEWQEGFSTLSTFSNKNGDPDSLQNFDEVNNRNQFLFTQASIYWNQWVLTAGASINQLKLKFRHFQPGTTGRQQRNFNNQLAPRLALLRKLGRISFYSSISKGFSPPSTAELLPTGGPINISLDPERGINYDLGVKGSFSGIFLDINAFLFSLRGTIVQRRDSAGGGYFINAGKTRQAGIETSINIPLGASYNDQFPFLFWFSHTWHKFLYKDFIQQNIDYSGNRLPGEPEHSIATGLDLHVKNGWNGGISYSYNSSIYLNDANTVTTLPTHILGCRLGWQKEWKGKWQLKMQVGGDNLLDQNYSLGNDLNATGGRYFNPAPGRNYYASLMFQWISRKISQ